MGGLCSKNSKGVGQSVSMPYDSKEVEATIDTAGRTGNESQNQKLMPNKQKFKIELHIKHL